MENQRKPMFVLAVITILIAVGLIMPVPARANNIQVANVVPVDQDTVADTINIQFDISWDNSWRVSLAQAPSNRDAAWVFAKWRLQSSTVWNHCTLSTTDLDHTTPAGSEIDASFSKDNDGKGVFIYRSSESNGSNDWDNIKLLWDYGTDGMSDNDVVEVRVFAIEMVYVPQGSFYLGDGTSTNTFYDNASSPNPANISTSPVTVNAGGGMSAGPIAVEGDNGITGNAEYPTGYIAFYCMKYEVSQSQYADFLNTLDRTQQNTRTETDVSTDVITNVYVMQNLTFVPNRCTIYCQPSGNGTTDPIVFGVDVPDRACNRISPTDSLAYMDWAGLRPMTELEFEKACRGPQNAVANEYAWGNANIAGSAYTLSNDGQYNESIATNYATDPTGNAMYTTTEGSINGPLRCGIFATSSSTRAEAGAGYYGVMEMSGNVNDLCVTLGNSTGRGFTGAHGDGTLDASGDADVSNWPTANGLGSRGGSWNWTPTRSRISDRGEAEGVSGTRQVDHGFRAVRTE